MVGVLPHLAPLLTPGRPVNAEPACSLTESRHGHLVGSHCPQFSVQGPHGEQFGARDLTGTPALIVFFPFAFSPICDEELSELNARIGEFEGIAILAVSCDAPASLRAWQERKDFAFELGSDFWPHGKAAEAFGVFDPDTGHARRASFVMTPTGTVTWSIISPAGKSRPVQEYLDALRAVTPEGIR